MKTLNDFKNTLLMFGLGLLLLLAACKEDPPQPDFAATMNGTTDPPCVNVDSFEADEVDDATEIVLGKKLNNPYTVSVMRKAIDSLIAKGQAYAYPILSESDIKATDYYVRFFVKTDADIERLEQDSLYLSAAPLDYEIASEGDVFKPDQLDKDQGIWLYTSVPISYNFPLGIGYQVLNELFLTEASYISGEETDSPTRLIHGKAVSAQFLDDLEDMALLHTDNFTEPAFESSALDYISERRKARPKGHVLVSNTTTRSFDAVPQVRVRTRRWFKYGKAWTSSSGSYSINRRYRRNCRYTVVFKNQFGKFKIRRATIAIGNARRRVGKHSPKGYTFKFGTNDKAWRFSTVSNAAVQYLDFCRATGVGLPHSNLKIAAGNGTGVSAAPMLSKVGNVPVLTTFFARFGIQISSSAAWRILSTALPDLIIKAHPSKQTSGVTELTFHEMAHASHFRLAGSQYWLNIMDYITFHGAYGNGNGKFAGYVEVAEMWAYYIDDRFMAIRRGFRPPPYVSPPSSGHWIKPDRMRRTVDDARYSLKELYSALRPNVASSCALQAELIQRYGKSIALLEVIYGCGGV